MGQKLGSNSCGGGELSCLGGECGGG